MTTRHIAAEHADARDLTPQGSGGGALRRFRRRLASDGFVTDEGWRPKEGYLYTVVRAISARVNQNYDGWPSDELKKSYKTFIGKPCFVNHENHDPTKARGVVVAARYVENGMDKYIEVVQEIDAGRFPKLAHEIKTGGLDSVSMGAEAGFTICSYCHNKATDLDDMCDHVRNHKGKTLRRFDKRTGKKEDVLVFESCHKISFFELSYVFEPADETAVASKVVVAGKKTASPDDDIPAWPHDLSHHLSEPTGYSAGYAAHFHPVFRDPEDDSYGREYEDLENSYHAAGGTGSDFEEGVNDAANGISHKLDEPEAYHAYQAEEHNWRKRNRDSVYQQKQDEHNRLREQGKPIYRLDNEPEMPKGLGFGIDRGVTTWEPDHENHPEGSWEGCPTCSDDGYGPKPVNYSDPDDKIDPFDPRLIGASRRTAEDLAVPAPPGTPTIDQSVIDATPVIELSPATELTGYEAPGVPKSSSFAADIAEITKLAADCPPGMDCSRKMPQGEQITKDSPNNPVNQVSADPNGTGANSNLGKTPASSSGGNDAIDTGGTLKPETVKLQDSLKQLYPGAEIGGYRPPDGYNEHSSGSALDFMTTDHDQAKAVMDHAFANGANYVIWDQKQWNPDGSTSMMEDRGNPTQNHKDHVHINVGSRTAGKYTKEDFNHPSGLKPWERDKDSDAEDAAAIEIEAMLLTAAGLPPASNAMYTSIKTTLNTYPKAHRVLDERGAPRGETLDFGAGQAGVMMAEEIGHDTFEPFPHDDYPPTFKNVKKVPKRRYHRVTSLNVLNTIQTGERGAVIRRIGQSLLPGGHAVVTARKWKGDVEKAAPHPDYEQPAEPNSVITDRTNPRFQHGYVNNQELVDELQYHLGEHYTVTPAFFTDEVHTPDGKVRKVRKGVGAVGAHIVYHGPRADRNAMKKVARQRALKLAYGEQEAPIAVNTLREEGSAPEDDNNDFEQYVDKPDFASNLTSPEELSDPDLSQAAQIDRQQEMQGADAASGQPGPESVQPPAMGGAPQQQFMTLQIPIPAAQQAGVPMAADPAPAPAQVAPEGQPMPVTAGLLNYFDAYYGRRVANWLDAIEANRAFTPEEAADYRRQTAKVSTLEKGQRLSTTNRNPGKEPANMARNTIASRNKVARAGRRHLAEGPLVDGGPYGRNDQGEQEEVFLSQTPPAEAGDYPTEDSNISNTEHNLVARVQQGRAQLLRDAQALASLRKRSLTEAGGPVAEVVDPTVNTGPEGEALTGTDFVSANPNDGVKPTNPHDASLRAFQAFDGWLAQKTGKSSRRHTEASIKKAAAQFSREAGISPQMLFPALGIVLREARKNDKYANTKGAKMRKRSNESLEVAAPDGRVDVEAPVENVTSAEAQASQFDIRDFGNNAGDNVANPDLSTDQNWAPGEASGKKASIKTAGGLLAMRCAEAMIAAGLEPNSRERKYALAAEFERMNRGLIQDRVALLERFAAVRQADRRKVASGGSRGAARSPIPAGLGGGTRTAATGPRLAAHDPRNDSSLFI